MTPSGSIFKSGKLDKIVHIPHPKPTTHDYFHSYNFITVHLSEHIWAAITAHNSVHTTALPNIS